MAGTAAKAETQTDVKPGVAVLRETQAKIALDKASGGKPQKDAGEARDAVYNAQKVLTEAVDYDQ